MDQPQTDPQAAERFKQAALAFVASRSSPRTREAYRRDLAEWLEYCAEAGVCPSSPTLDLATSYRDAVSGKLATASLRRKLAVLSAVYRAAVERQPPAATWNPFATRSLPRPAAPRFGKTEAAPEDLAAKMLEAASADASREGARDAAVLSVLYATGLRRVSVASLRRENVFRRSGMLVARTLIKGGEEVEVEIPAPYDNAVSKWYALGAKDGSAWLFPGRDKARPMSLQMVNKIVAAWAFRVGGAEARVHPHCFRVSFVTGLYDAGANERDIQAAVHHKDPRSTQRYDRGRRGSGAAGMLAEFRRKKAGED